MFLVVGLGNPGSKYENTRHNIGFMAVDAMHRRHSFSAWSEKFKADMSKGDIDGNKAILLKPLTFMNLSGESIQQAAHFFKISPENIIVLHDELDLEPLRVKIKIGGGNGGHNGLKSTQQMLGTPNFKRIRIGIGHPGSKDKVSPFVLSDFSKKERPDFDVLCEHLADYLPKILSGKDANVMNELARSFGGSK